MSKKLKRLSIILLISISISGVVLKIYEPVSTENLFINILKRTVAETGAFAINVYDPYKNSRRVAFLGPYSDIKGRNTIKTNNGFIKLEEKDLKSKLKIITYNNNPIIKSPIEFDYQIFDDPKLKILRERYKLEEVIRNGESEFQRQIILRDWIRQRWGIGKPSTVSYNFDALNILERAQKGEKFFCSEYAATYVQVLASLSMTARYVGLFKGHIAVEVWSNEFDKWIVMDPHFNIHYEYSGIPLNALELHDAWISRKWNKIKVIKGNYQQPSEDTTDNYKFKLIDYYENFYVRMRNDWFSNIYPHWYPKSNSIMNGVEWSDKITKNDIRIANETSNKDDLYWQLNHVYVKAMDYNILEETIVLKLFLDTITPNFDKFLIKIDEKEIINTVQSNFDWELHKGVNILEVASVNKFGIEGILTRISINYE